MNQQYPDQHPFFFTATILHWKYLLKENAYKNIIIESLRFLVIQKRTRLFAFVIMNNHIHLIWQPLPGYTASQVQQCFMKFTAQQIKFQLLKNNLPLLKEFEVDSRDRKYQFWQRNSLSVELFSEKVFNQKINYIHMNPVKAGYCTLPEEYEYSSAKFYYLGIDNCNLFI